MHLCPTCQLVQAQVGNSKPKSYILIMLNASGLNWSKTNQQSQAELPFILLLSLQLQVPNIGWGNKKLCPNCSHLLSTWNNRTSKLGPYPEQLSGLESHGMSDSDQKKYICKSKSMHIMECLICNHFIWNSKKKKKFCKLPENNKRVPLHTVQFQQDYLKLGLLGFTARSSWATKG